MQAFLEDNQYLLLIVALFGMLILATLLESVIPRRREPEKLGYRWANNLGLWAVGQLNVSWMTTFAAVGAAWWSGGEPMGLFRYVDIGFWPAVVLAILIFELVSYLFHLALHSVPWLWRIHMVHHTDTEVDFTTTYRAHPLDLLIIAPLTVPIVLLLGFPASVMVVYQLLRTSITIFAHTNIYVPEAMDRVLRYVIVTPDFHRLHHCSERRFTDSNYSAAFPIFDYLFGTASNRPFADHKDLELGLECYRDPIDSRFDRLLWMPFRKQPAREPVVPQEPLLDPIPQSAE